MAKYVCSGAKMKCSMGSKVAETIVLTATIAIIHAALIIGVSGCGGNITWTLQDNGTLNISGKGAMADYYGKRYPPWNKIKDRVTSVIIDNGVAYIGSRAFEGCANLTSVTISGSVASIGAFAFRECINLTSVNISNGVTAIGAHAFSGCANLTSVTIPNSVTEIGEFTFSECVNLTSINIPNGVIVIGLRAFSECTNLTSITIPKSVMHIGSLAFQECENLTIEVEENNARYCSEDGVLFNKTKDTLIRYPMNRRQGAYAIPSGATSIRFYAFSKCANLTSVTIPNSVTDIGEYAFLECVNLRSVTIPRSVASIMESTFKKCTSLTSVAIEDGVTNMGTSAFAECSNLKSVTIPYSVKSIGNRTFNDCSRLMSVISLNPVPFFDVGTGVFNGLPQEACLYVPEGSVDKYRTASGRGPGGWASFKCVKTISALGDK
jgi:hypothetical protein